LSQKPPIDKPDSASWAVDGLTWEQELSDLTELSDNDAAVRDNDAVSDNDTAERVSKRASNYEYLGFVTASHLIFSLLTLL
jgi:hypothetical protein